MTKFHLGRSKIAYIIKKYGKDCVASKEKLAVSLRKRGYESLAKLLND